MLRFFHIGLSCSCEMRLIQSQDWRSVSCSISEIMGGNPAGDLKIFSGFLLGSCLTCNFEDHSLIFTTIINQILASDCLVLSFFSHIHLLTFMKQVLWREVFLFHWPEYPTFTTIVVSLFIDWCPHSWCLECVLSNMWWSGYVLFFQAVLGGFIKRCNYHQADH